MRRVLAALLTGTATWLVVSALVPHPVEAGVPVLVAARDLAAGARVGPADVQVERRASAQLPGSALAAPADALGRVTAGPVAAGELLTSTRFRGPVALGGLVPPRVAVSVPLVDGGLLAAVRPGDSVTLMAPGTGVHVATRATVLSVGAPTSGGDAGGGPGVLVGPAPDVSGSRVVVALTDREATAVAAAMGGASGPSGFVMALDGG